VAVTSRSSSAGGETSQTLDRGLAVLRLLGSREHTDGDTFQPLELGEAGRAVDDGKYAWSWIGGKDEQSLDGAG